MRDVGDGHRVILRRPRKVRLKEITTMTADPILTCPRSWPSTCERAEPDLLRALLTTFVQALMCAEADAVCGAEYGAAQRRSGPTPATATGTATATPGPAPSMWRSPSCAQGSYFPDWLLERRKRAERGADHAWWRPATCSGSPPGGWTSWSRPWDHRPVEVAGLGDGQATSTSRSRRSAPGRWTPARTRSWPPTR